MEKITTYKFLKKKPYPNTHNYSQIEMKKKMTLSIFRY